MVLEYGDIDLARLLAKHEQARREGGGADELDENFIRLYWQQMLQVCDNLCLLPCFVVRCSPADSAGSSNLRLLTHPALQRRE